MRIQWWCWCIFCLTEFLHQNWVGAGLAWFDFGGDPKTEKVRWCLCVYDCDCVYYYYYFTKRLIENVANLENVLELTRSCSIMEKFWRNCVHQMASILIERKRQPESSVSFNFVTWFIDIHPTLNAPAPISSGVLRQYLIVCWTKLCPDEIHRSAPITKLTIVHSKKNDRKIIDTLSQRTKITCECCCMGVFRFICIPMSAGMSVGGMIVCVNLCRIKYFVHVHSDWTEGA